MKNWAKKTNWLDLPADVAANILHRLGAVEILESAQKVCTAWRGMCKDPAMWRVIDMQNHGSLGDMPYDLEKMCKHAIDRSQGQVFDINIEYFGTDELMEYFAKGGRSSQLKRLQVSYCYGMIYGSWIDFLKKSPRLEEIELTFTDITEDAIAYAGRYCPGLKIFKLNDKGYYMHGLRAFNQEIADYADDIGMAIAKGMPQLRHLELIGNAMTNKGLQAILDGCPQLESLDLRRCLNINLDGCGKLCMERIKNLMLPHDSLKGHKFALDDGEDYQAMCVDHRAKYDGDEESYLETT